MTTRTLAILLSVLMMILILMIMKLLLQDHFCPLFQIRCCCGGARVDIVLAQATALKQGHEMMTMVVMAVIAGEPHDETEVAENGAGSLLLLPEDEETRDETRELCVHWTHRRS